MRLAGASAPAAAAPDPRLVDAARGIEAEFVKQIVETSGLFKGGEGPGSAVRAGLFADALSAAVTRSGGVGLADEIVRSLTPGATLPSPLPAPAPIPLPPRPTIGPGPGEDAPLPVAGRVTSPFGTRIDPITGETSSHPGIDVGAPAGTPILAPAAGVVKLAGPLGGYGNAVEIDHGHGLVTLYGHASQVLVHTGDSIEAGQEIATVGSTGRSTGPHLHFEVRLGGRPVDPRRALKMYGLRAEGSHGSGP